jgi:hypothetical protein
VFRNFANTLPIFVQAHLVSHDLTEQAFSIDRTKRDKVCPDSRIIVTRQAHMLAFQQHAHANWSAPCRILLGAAG